MHSHLSINDLAASTKFKAKESVAFLLIGGQMTKFQPKSESIQGEAIIGMQLKGSTTRVYCTKTPPTLAENFS